MPLEFKTFSQAVKAAAVRASRLSLNVDRMCLSPKNKACRDLVSLSRQRCREIRAYVTFCALRESLR